MTPDLLHECPECETCNNLVVNPRRCYSCGHEWEPRALPGAALSHSGP